MMDEARPPKPRFLPVFIGGPLDGQPIDRGTIGLLGVHAKDGKGRTVAYRERMMSAGCGVGCATVRALVCIDVLDHDAIGPAMWRALLDHGAVEELPVPAKPPEPEPETTEPAELERGWFFPAGARKCHFDGGDGRALCGTWTRMSLMIQAGADAAPSKDDCVACRRRLEAESGG